MYRDLELYCGSELHSSQGNVDEAIGKTAWSLQCRLYKQIGMTKLEQEEWFWL